jgi:hypothetical protein
MRQVFEGTSRREFIGRVAQTAAAAAALAAIPGSASALGDVAPATGQRASWDMSWTERLTAPHRAVFEMPSISDGVALYQATMYMDGYRAAFGEKGDAQVVLVMRSGAVPMAMNDVIWEKYGIAEQVRARGPKNPYLTGDHGSLAALRARGAILLACNMATMGQAESIASRVGADVEAVKQEVRTNLAPGVLLMPNGVFAVLCAQDLGCKYFRAV